MFLFYGILISDPEKVRKILIEKLIFNDLYLNYEFYIPIKKPLDESASSEEDDYDDEKIKKTLLTSGMGSKLFIDSLERDLEAKEVVFEKHLSPLSIDSLENLFPRWDSLEKENILSLFDFTELQFFHQKSKTNEMFCIILKESLETVGNLSGLYRIEWNDSALKRCLQMKSLQIIPLLKFLEIENIEPHWYVWK